jgi:hypothetical protein
MQDDKNELDPKLLNVNSFSPYHAYTSASRLVMSVGHLGQALVINGGQQRRTMSGREAEYGKYTFSAKMPRNASVLNILKKYPSNFGHNSIKANPETIVIYEISDGVRDIEYDCLVLEQHSINHQHFGFEFKPTENISNLREGAFIPKDTTFLQSPNIDEDGGYKLGINAKAAYVTHPSLAEDGLLVRRGFLNSLKFTTYQTRIVGFGSKDFAVGAYSKDGLFKSIPVIGDKIRADGVVCSLREMVKKTSGVDQAAENSEIVDAMFDSIVYSEPDGEVVDVTIIAKENISADATNLQTEIEYSDYYINYQRSIVDAYNKISRQCKQRHGREPKLGNTFHSLVVKAKTIIESKNAQQRIKLSQRKEPLDNVHVEILIKYTHTPNIGSKLTGISGDKGVICTSLEDEYMPVDMNGVRADICMEPSISRMNLGRYYEPYINASADKVHLQICKAMNVKPYTAHKFTMNESVKYSWSLLKDFLSTINPDVDLGEQPDSVVCESIEHVVLKNISTFIPTNHPRRLRDVVKIIMNDNRFRPNIGPITMKLKSGKTITTKNNVLIGDLYILLLQQTGSDWSATSSGRTQIHGLLAATSRSTKHTTPYKDQGTRTLGESELRIIAAYCGGNVAAHLHNINNNPTLHKVNCDNISNAVKPTNIKDACEGANTNVCGNGPINMSRHILQCYGLQLTYQPYNPNIASTQTPSKDLISDDLNEL